MRLHSRRSRPLREFAFDCCATNPSTITGVTLEAQDDQRPPLRQRPWTLLFVVVAIGIPVLFYTWFTWSMVSGGLQLRSAASELKSGYANKDAAEIANAAQQADTGMSRINTAMWSIPLRLASTVPWYGTTISNVQHLSSAGAQVTSAMVPVAQKFDPNLYHDGTINLPALDALLAQLPALSPAIGAAREDLNAVSESGPFGGLFAQARDTGMAFADLGEFAADEVAPQRPLILDSLGAKTPQKYMIAFENPAQLRAPGGAPLSAAILEFDKGKMTIPFNGYIAGDAFKGHPLIQYTPASPPPWGADAAGLGFVNSGAHPDWRLAGEDLMRAWNTAKDPKVDAMIGMDTRAIESLIRATGPIEVEGYGTLTADNFAQKVVTDAYLDFQSDQKARQGLNDKVAQVMIGRLMSGDLQTLASAAVALSAETPGRHLQMRFENPGLQKLAVSGESAGEVYQTPGNDTLGFFSRNRNMSKVDVYSQRDMVSNVTINADGSANVEQTLTVKNNAPSELDTNAKIGYTTAWSANEWFFYLPIGATDAQIQAPSGYTKPKTHPDGLGRVVATTEGTIAPQATDTLTFTYRIPAGTFSLNGGGYRYHNQLNPQPMQQDVNLSLNVRFADGAKCTSNPGWTATSDGARWTGQQSIRRTLNLECS